MKITLALTVETYVQNFLFRLINDEMLLNGYNNIITQGRNSFIMTT
jgi:hypothetical protein